MITSLTNGSTFKALSADATTAHGLGLDLFVMDEAAQQRDSALWDVLFTSQSARKNPKAIAIGTRPQDPQHFFSKMIDYGGRVLTGEYEDPSFFCHVLAAPDDADWQDEAVWRAVNPCLDAGVQDIKSLRELVEQAKRIPSKEGVFRALHLNQAVNADDRFVPWDDWQACGGPIDVDALRGETCYGGLDLGSTQDLTSLVLYFPASGAVLCWCWLPGDPSLLDRGHKDHVEYQTWANAGHIETFPGRSTDRRAVAFRLAEVCSQYDVRGIAYDRWRIEDLQKILADEGIDAPLKPWGQGYRDMSPAVDALETEIIEHRLRHGNNPALTWCVGNVVVSTDPAGSRKFDKGRATARIDAAQALAMSLGLASREPEPLKYDFDRPLVISA
jgi:phage terminase large subunit-like protein